MPSARGSSPPRDGTRVSGVSCITGGFFTTDTETPQGPADCARGQRGFGKCAPGGGGLQVGGGTEAKEGGWTVGSTGTVQGRGAPPLGAVLGALGWACPHGIPGQEGEEVTNAVRLATPGHVALCRNPDLKLPQELPGLSAGQTHLAARVQSRNTRGAQLGTSVLCF